MEVAEPFGDAAVAVALNGKIGVAFARTQGNFIPRQPDPSLARGNAQESPRSTAFHRKPPRSLIKRAILYSIFTRALDGLFLNEPMQKVAYF